MKEVKMLETMQIFEGKALFTELDKMLAPKPTKK